MMPGELQPSSRLIFTHLRDGQHYAMRLLEFLNCWRALPSCYATLNVRKQAFLALSFVDHRASPLLVSGRPIESLAILFEMVFKFFLKKKAAWHSRSAI